MTRWLERKKTRSVLGEPIIVRFKNVERVLQIYTDGKWCNVFACSEETRKAADKAPIAKSK